MSDFLLNFGTAVQCFEDQCGNLAKVAFNPKSWQVSDLIVEEGMLLKRSRVFPFSVIEQATNDRINIAVYEDDLNGYPEYRETVVETMPETGNPEPAMVQGSPYGLATSAPTVPMVRQVLIEGVSDNLEIFDKETPVIVEDSTIGKVRGLAVIPENGLITHILVHKGTIFVEEFWLSSAKVARMGTKGVFVNITKAEFDELIEYDEANGHSWDHMPTDEFLKTAGSGSDLSIEEKKQTITETDMNDGAALRVMVADALLDDPRTEETVIEVINDRGVITLQGTVDDIETKQAAEEIAKGYPGVVSVTNELVVNAQ